MVYFTIEKQTRSMFALVDADRARSKRTDELLKMSKKGPARCDAAHRQSNSWPTRK